MVQENGTGALPSDRATHEPSPTVSAVPVGIPSAIKGRGTIFYVGVEQAQEPKTGECITGHWWSVHPEHGLAFYAQLTGYAASEAPSPQCNQCESTARLLTSKLYPDHAVRLIPVVFMRHAEQAMATLRAQAIETRRAETGTGSVHESAVRESECAPATSTSPTVSES